MHTCLVIINCIFIDVVIIAISHLVKYARASLFVYDFFFKINLSIKCQYYEKHKQNWRANYQGLHFLYWPGAENKPSPTVFLKNL